MGYFGWRIKCSGRVVVDKGGERGRVRVGVFGVKLKRLDLYK